jgi:hypothetical protein
MKMVCFKIKLVMSSQRREHCSKKDGVKRCEPLHQYEKRMKKKSSRKSRKVPKGRKAQNPSENAEVLNSAFRNMSMKKQTKNRIHGASGRKTSIKNQYDWTLHKDFAVPDRKFSSFRFSDVNRAKELYGVPKITVESNILTRRIGIPHEVYDDSSDDTSQDYSSSDGTSSDNNLSSSDSSSSDSSSDSESD